MGTNKNRLKKRVKYVYKFLPINRTIQINYTRGKKVKKNGKKEINTLQLYTCLITYFFYKNSNIYIFNNIIHNIPV